MRREDIRVWAEPRDVDWKPDILHCQHAQETWRLLAAFPATPSLYVCHDAKVWFDAAPPPPLISKYVAVDTFCRERVVRETGCAADSVAIIHNGVDLAKFRQKETIALRPSRALLFVSDASDFRCLDSVRAACRQLGLPLDEIGGAAGKKINDPENMLGRYDIVFAKARCAFEAMACGCAVVLVGSEGLGPMVTPDDFDTMYLRNFGRSLLQPSFDENLLVTEIHRYDRAKVTEVCGLVRTRCGLDRMVDAFVDLYAEIIRSTPTVVLSRNDALFQYGAALLQHVETERAALATTVYHLSNPPPKPPEPVIEKPRRWFGK